MKPILNRKRTLFFACIFLTLFCNGQMTAGFYPYQIVDSLTFEKNSNLLQFDTLIRPNNFISTTESDSKLAAQITDVKDYFSNRIKKIHSETNNRDFIAGISNFTNDTISLPIQDKSVIAILEAKYKSEKWKPIQFWPISGCGNSYFDQAILPGQTLLFPVKKEFGKNNALMRIRVHGIDKIFVSEVFSGTVNDKIFHIEENVIQQYRHILCDSIFFLERPLYGKQNIDKIKTESTSYEELDSVGKAKIDFYIFSQIPYSKKVAKADIKNNNIQIVRLRPWGSPMSSPEELSLIEQRFGFHFVSDFFQFPTKYLEKSESDYNCVMYTYLDSINKIDTKNAIETELARMYYERQVYAQKTNDDLQKNIRKKLKGEQNEIKKQMFHADITYRDRNFTEALKEYHRINRMNVEKETKQYLANSIYHCLLNLKRFEEANLLKCKTPGISPVFKQ